MVESRQEGFVLIMVLMLLSVLSFLVVATLQNNALELKMSRNFSDQVVAFYDAEAALDLAKRKILGVSHTAQKSLAKIHYQIKLNGVDDCERAIYLLYASGEYHGAKVLLAAEYKLIQPQKIPRCYASSRYLQLMWWRRL